MTEDEKKTQEARISSAVYAACIKIFEGLEAEREIFGNGHHAAQKVAAFAVEELKNRWTNRI